MSAEFDPLKDNQIEYLQKLPAELERENSNLRARNRFLEKLLTSLYYSDQIMGFCISRGTMDPDEWDELERELLPIAARNEDILKQKRGW